MRVIAGRYRRRLLESLPGDETRPMLDRMREQLFNILQGRVEGLVFADLFAGTGAVGIEALSRGAKQAIFVESNTKALRVIERNLEALGAARDARVVLGRVQDKLSFVEADVYFLGPPYADHKAYEETLAILAEREPELVIAQHGRDYEPPTPPGLEKYRVVRSGTNLLSFYRTPETDPDAESEA